MTAFQPDCIIAIGGGCAMDAAKIMWVLYEHPDADFMDMAMRFMRHPQAHLHLPQAWAKRRTSSPSPPPPAPAARSRPSRSSPIEDTGVKYPLADYELMPKMAIVDADMMMNAPKGLTSASGIDAVTHALEAYRQP